MSFPVHLTDFVKIDPNPALTKLSREDKFRLMDSALNEGDTEPRGLEITFDLSHSGRRINNRIYTVRGQQAGLDSWIEPFEKPILVNHDTNGDPLGRIKEVRWNALDSQAVQFFPNVQDYMELKRAFDSDNPRKIYKAMHKANLLLDTRWPGLGVLQARATIFDKDAIERFLDGRYMTFSAGTSTDRYVCGICGDDWAKGDVCDHRPGAVHEDGLVGTFVTGIFSGREASVVNSPADTLSKLTSVRFGDSITLPQDFDLGTLAADGASVYIADATISTAGEVHMNDSAPSLVDQDPRELIRKISDGDTTLLTTLLDALKGDTLHEQLWLARMHDSLHHQFDYELKYMGEEGDNSSIPTDVFKLHGQLHQISMDRGFRDSLINGPLDGFDMKGAPSTEYMVKSRAADSEESTMTEDQLRAILTEVLNAQKSDDNTEDQNESDQSTEETTEETSEDSSQEVEDQDGVQDTTEENEEDQEGQEEVNDELNVNWELLALALKGSVGADAVSDEEIATLDDKFFVGPDRKVAIPNQVYADAALALVAKIGASDEDQEALKSAIEQTQVSVEDFETQFNDLNEKYQKLTTDYAQALQKIEELQERLANEDGSDDNIADDSTSSQDEQGTSLDIDPVDNPSDASSDSGSKKTLSPYEQKVFSKYKIILRDQGQRAADHYVVRQRARGYVSRDFNPQTLTQE